MANGFNVPPVNLNMYTPTGSQMQLSPVRNVLGSQQPMPYSSAGISSILQGIQQRTPQREAFAGVPFPRPTMLPQQGVPVPQPRPADMPKTPPSGLDQLRAAQLRMPARGTPQGAGLSAASQQLLAASGYTDKPLSMGQILGSAGAAYTEAEQAARDRSEEKRRQDLADQLALATFELDVAQAMKPEKPETTAAITNALSMGLKMGTPEFNEYIRMATGKTGEYTRVITNPDGSVEYVTGSGKPPEMASKTKGGLEEKLLTSDATLNSLISAQKMYTETMSQFAPRFNMAITNLKGGFGFKISDEDREEAVKFVQTASRINEVFSDTLNELSGAAVSTQENTRIRTSYGYLGSIANPFSGDSPIEFQAKINGQINALRSINVRAKLLLTGDKQITDDLARKYPLDYTVGGDTVFFSDFIDDALDRGLAETEIEAANLWADEISELRANEANQ
jgi:hypothetical protein